jgi:hypothetical protein
MRRRAIEAEGNTTDREERPATPDLEQQLPVHEQSVALTRLEQWLADGDAVREQLERELAEARGVVSAAQARVRRIEDALARLGGAARGPSQATVEAAGDEPNLDGAPIPQVLWFAVDAHPSGATASEIQRWVSAKGREITTKYLHTYLHRMTRDGRLVGRGEKGHRLYFVGQWKEGDPT